VLAHPYLFALLLAVAELAVGVWALIGLASRLAAGLGLALSVTFFLTRQLAGPAVLLRRRPSLRRRVADAAARRAWRPAQRRRHAAAPPPVRAGLGPSTLVAVPLDRLQQQCPDVNEQGRCTSAAGDACAGGGCLLAASRPSQAATDASRRTFLAAAGKAGQVVAGTLVLAASAAPTIAARERSLTTDRFGFRQVGYLRQLPVGHGELVERPTSGLPAILVRLAEDQLVGYDAICTHAKCVVGFDTDRRLIVCACHGAEFDPARGAAVVAGPAPRPLPPVPVRVDRDGTISIQG
jgi:Rieske Fe-S protein